jgi:glycosyltransferase involved in cell wall biosynthesis
LSLTLLEAFAVGRGVVVSDVPGLAEVVTPDVGARVPPDDPAALADAVARRLLNVRAARDEGAAAARHAGRFDVRLTFERRAAETTAVLRHRDRPKVGIPRQRRAGARQFGNHTWQSR